MKTNTDNLKAYQSAINSRIGQPCSRCSVKLDGENSSLEGAVDMGNLNFEAECDICFTK